MKKTFLSYIFFLFFPFLMDAQTWQWAKDCPTDSSGFGDGSSVCTDSNGNIFITGYYSGTLVAGSYTLSGATGNSYLIKYDAGGNVIWARAATGDNDIPYSVCTDNSGNAYITGYFSGPTITFGTYTLTNNGMNNVFLVKYDPNGNVIWARQSVNTDVAYAFSVSSDANGNAYISGNFQSAQIVFGTYTLTNATSNPMFLVKYDPNGNVIWARTAVGDVMAGNVGYVAVSVSAEANGNTFVAGTFNYQSIVFGTYTLNTSGKSIFITKYDPAGNVLWAKSVDGPSSGDAASSVSADGSGNAYITGQITSSIAIFGTFTLTNTGSNVFLAKYDSNGNVLWVRASVGGSGYNPGTGGLSVSSGSCGAFITGNLYDFYGNATITLGSYTLPPPVGSFDPAFIAQYDGNGNVIFAQVFPSGSDATVSLDKSSNVYLTGSFSVNNFSIGTNTLTLTGQANTFLAKLSYTNCQAPLGMNEFLIQNQDIKLFPNPNSGQFKIQIDEEIENGEIIIFNSVYQKVYSQIVTRGENEINFKEFAAGLYYYSVIQNDQTFKSGKISIQ